MTKLEYYVNFYANNSANFCCLPNIRVSGVMAFNSEQTYYSSYVPQQDGAFSNLMVGPVPSESIPVDYIATNCSYNVGGSRVASSICISDSGVPKKGGTNCLTFHQS